MPRRQKRFAELWRDATFEARREEHIGKLEAAIADGTAPDDPGLRPLLDRYTRAETGDERYAAALEIERAAKRPGKSRRLPLQLVMHSVFGPEQQPGESAEAFRRRQIRHSVWAIQHGVWWRAQHGCLNASDRAKLADMALEADEDDVVDELASCRSEAGGWNANALKRLQRDLLAPYDLSVPEPPPPFAAEVPGEAVTPPCECCVELLEQYEADGTVVEIIGGLEKRRG